MLNCFFVGLNLSFPFCRCVFCWDSLVIGFDCGLPAHHAWNCQGEGVKAQTQVGLYNAYRKAIKFISSWPLQSPSAFKPWSWNMLFQRKLWYITICLFLGSDRVGAEEHSPLAARITPGGRSGTSGPSSLLLRRHWLCTRTAPYLKTKMTMLHKL